MAREIREGASRCWTASASLRRCYKCRQSTSTPHQVFRAEPTFAAAPAPPISSSATSKKAVSPFGMRRKAIATRSSSRGVSGRRGCFRLPLPLAAPFLPRPFPEGLLSRSRGRSRGRSWGRCAAASFFVKLLLKPSCHLLVVGRRGPSLAHQSDQVRPRHDRNKTLKRISRLLLVGPGQAPEQVQVRRLALDLHIHG